MVGGRSDDGATDWKSEISRSEACRRELSARWVASDAAGVLSIGINAERGLKAAGTRCCMSRRESAIPGMTLRASLICGMAAATVSNLSLRDETRDASAAVSEVILF